SNAPEASLQGPTPSNEFMQGFLEEMRALGWQDGQNINIERRSIGGKPESVAPLIEALRGQGLDLVVLSLGTDHIPAAKEAIGSSPVVRLGVGPAWGVGVGGA